MTADPDAPPRTDLTPLVEGCRRRGAAAFVAVGDRRDADVRHLTRLSSTDRSVALIVVPGGASSDEPGPRAALVAPEPVEEYAERRFLAPALDGGQFHDGVTRAVRTVRTEEAVGERAIGERAAAVLAELLGPTEDAADPAGTVVDATVLVPRSIPHDAAVYLEQTGASAASTTAATDARAVKSDAEIDRLRRVQRAAVGAMARAETMLAASTTVAADTDADGEMDDADGRMDDADGEMDDDRDSVPELYWRGEPLTTERLRRRVNAALAEAGATDAGNTVVGAGTAAATAVGSGGSRVIRPGETVLVDLTPRGRDGYHGRLARTFVVESDGGWERRAYVAVSAAREAALAAIEPGADASAICREASAELAAYGFDPNADPDAPGVVPELGHGIGVARRDPPSLRSETTLRTGHAIAVGPGVSDPDVGGVRLADLVVVDEDGCETVAPYPFGTAPERPDG